MHNAAANCITPFQKLQLVLQIARTPDSLEKIAKKADVSLISLAEWSSEFEQFGAGSFIDGVRSKNQDVRLKTILQRYGQSVCVITTDIWSSTSGCSANDLLQSDDIQRDLFEVVDEGRWRGTYSAGTLSKKKWPVEIEGLKNVMRRAHDFAGYTFSTCFMEFELTKSLYIYKQFTELGAIEQENICKFLDILRPSDVGESIVVERKRELYPFSRDAPFPLLCISFDYRKIAEDWGISEKNTNSIGKILFAILEHPTINYPSLVRDVIFCPDALVPRGSLIAISDVYRKRDFPHDRLFVVRATNVEMSQLMTHAYCYKYLRMQQEQTIREFLALAALVRDENKDRKFQRMYKRQEKLLQAELNVEEFFAQKQEIMRRLNEFRNGTHCLQFCFYPVRSDIEPLMIKEGRFHKLAYEDFKQKEMIEQLNDQEKEFHRRLRAMRQYSLDHMITISTEASLILARKMDRLTMFIAFLTVASVFFALFNILTPEQKNQIYDAYNIIIQLIKKIFSIIMGSL